MFSEEQRRMAIETFIRFDHGYADTIAELGYPNRGMLHLWRKEYEEHEHLVPRKLGRKPRHGETGRLRLLPGAREEPCAEQVRHGAPQQSAACGAGRRARARRAEEAPRHAEPLQLPPEQKIQSIAEPEARTGTAAEVAERHGMPRTEPSLWRRGTMGDNDGGAEENGAAVSKGSDDLPDDVVELRDMLREAKMRLRKVELEVAARNATLEIAKKTRAPTRTG